MRIGLHDNELSHFKREKTFPNLAIMKLSAYHKSKGDSVEWWNSVSDFDKVYSSKVFTFSKLNSNLPTNTIKGGTGYDIESKLPSEIDSCYPDYSIYPNCDYAVGFTTRGCIKNCDFCIVQQKEGYIKPYCNWQDIVRKDSNKLVLLDNNILASEHGRKQLEQLSETDYLIDLNQGMDITLVDDDICRLFKQIKWLKYIRFSCDKIEQIPHFVRIFELFQRYGIASSKVFIYMLIRDDLSDAKLRVDTLYHLCKNWSLYAQAEHKFGGSINWLAVQFTRYVYSRAYKLASWQEYIDKYLIKKASYTL